MCALRVVRFILGHWVHSGAPGWLSGSFRVVGLIWVCHGGLSVRLGSVGFIQVHPVGRRIHSGSLGLFRCALGVV